MYWAFRVWSWRRMEWKRGVAVTLHWPVANMLHTSIFGHLTRSCVKLRSTHPGWSIGGSCSQWACYERLTEVGCCFKCKWAVSHPSSHANRRIDSHFHGNSEFEPEDKHKCWRRSEPAHFCRSVQWNQAGAPHRLSPETFWISDNDLSTSMCRFLLLFHNCLVAALQHLRQYIHKTNTLVNKAGKMTNMAKIKTLQIKTNQFKLLCFCLPTCPKTGWRLYSLFAHPVIKYKSNTTIPLGQLKRNNKWWQVEQKPPVLRYFGWGLRRQQGRCSKTQLWPTSGPQTCRRLQSQHVTSAVAGPHLVLGPRQKWPILRGEKAEEGPVFQRQYVIQWRL